MADNSFKVESAQQEKENINTDSGMSTLSKDGSSILTNPHDEKAEVLIGDQSEDGEIPPPKAQEASQVINNENSPSKS